MAVYDFSKLDKTKIGIFNNFKIKICSKNSPLAKTNNEEDLRFCFENELNKLLRDLEFIGNNYEFFSHENKNEKGRTDFQYGNTIIEYKTYNRLSKTKDLKDGQNQIQNYLKDKRFSGFTMFGFLFDGVQIYSYKKDENDKIIYDNINSGNLTALNLNNLITIIFKNGLIAISPNNLKKDFGIVDKFNRLSENQEIFNLIKYLFNLLSSDKKLNPRTELLYKEWEKLFRLAENDNGQHQDIVDRREIFAKIFGKIINSDTEYKAFFALHTTLSIIIKLLIVRIICDKIKIDDFYKTDSLNDLKIFFENMENGKYFQKLGIINLTDNDFFSWYIKEEFNDEFKEILQKIIFKICVYENIHIAKNIAMLDMFKELYLNFIPKVVRHSFGEYYTPYWLAERTFLSATASEQNYNNKTYIDPNCGSGTFLSVFFNYKHKNLEEKIDFFDFTNGIVGVDINPIAVLMARANVLIQGLQKCEFDITKKYEIPVYLADSLYVPNLIKIDNIDCFDYELYTASLQTDFGIDKIHIILPKELVLKDNFLEIINEAEKSIIKFDNKKAIDTLLKYLNVSKNSKEIKKLIADTIDELIKFEKKKLNSIWLKIFSNYFRVATFDKFDYIIGNPAWVQWSVLPENYRNNIKANMRMDGLFSNDKNVGGNNLNICALIANKCCERWLKDEGKFCFLMPKSILFNKSFEGFRNLIISQNQKMYFNEVIDFSNGGEIFDGVGLNFCAFKISKKANRVKDIIPLIDYKRNSARVLSHNENWEDIRSYFSSNDFFAVQLNTEFNNNFLIVSNLTKAKKLKSLIGKCEYQFRKGVSVEYPMRLKFVKLDKNKKLGIFNPYQKIGARLKVDDTQEIKLELEFIKPFISAPMLSDNKSKHWQNDYAICPYVIGEKKPLSLENLKKKAPYIYKYLTDIEEKLGNGSRFNKRVQNFDEFYGILRMGNYVWAKYFVCIRDNTKLSPTLFSEIKTHWGAKITPLFDNHISFISEVYQEKKHERFIDLIEAKYILKKLCDKDTIEIILNSQDSRSISSRLPVKLALYK